MKINVKEKGTKVELIEGKDGAVSMNFCGDPVAAIGLLTVGYVNVCKAVVDENISTSDIIDLFSKTVCDL